MGGKKEGGVAGIYRKGKPKSSYQRVHGVQADEKRAHSTKKREKADIRADWKKETTACRRGLGKTRFTTGSGKSFFYREGSIRSQSAGKKGADMPAAKVRCNC